MCILLIARCFSLPFFSENLLGSRRKGKTSAQPRAQTTGREGDDSDTDRELGERQQPRRQKRRKEGSERGEEEAEFEARPRLSRWEEEEREGLHYLLPLKTKKGLVQQPAVYRPIGKLVNLTVCNNRNLK